MPPTSQLLEFLGHHPIIFALLGLAIIVFIANEMAGAMMAGVRLAPADAVRLINDREAVIVDVRPVADFKKGHLLNAINLPLQKLDERVAEVGKDKAKPVVVYCALGGTAVEAARTLRKAGYTEVYPIRGGINSWLGSNLPVTVK